MTPTMMALKEWATAVDALLKGDLVLLIRKGGIREAKPVFDLPSDRALLFPTYEHQATKALRSPWSSALIDRAVPQVGEAIALEGWVHITHQFRLVSADLTAIVETLRPFHIWTDEWLTERLTWKPERPAYGLLLRTYRLPSPLSLTYEKRYGGCRSWIEVALPEILSAENLSERIPVLTDETYAERVEKIRRAIAPVTSPSAFRA